MEKFTKEYAEQLAEQNVIYGGSIADCVFGYMKAIEETGAKEAIEALIELEKLTFSLDINVDGLTALALQSCRTRVNNAINKAAL